MQIQPGAQVRAQRIVGETDTAIAVGTGEVPVLATSRVSAWCEQATFEALRPHTATGSTSVAMRVQIDHIRAVPVGSVVTTVVTLERVEGRRYVFDVSALDGDGEELASGRIVRVVVETETFLAKAFEGAT